MGWKEVMKLYPLLQEYKNTSDSENTNTKWLLVFLQRCRIHFSYLKTECLFKNKGLNVIKCPCISSHLYVSSVLEFYLFSIVDQNYQEENSLYAFEYKLGIHKKP